MELNFEDVEDLLFEPKNSRSKYRDIILNVLEYFDTTGKNAVKLNTDFGADADNLAKGCRNWCKSDENVIIIKKDKTVYFLRKDDNGI